MRLFTCMSRTRELTTQICWTFDAPQPSREPYTFRLARAGRPKRSMRSRMLSGPPMSLAVS